MPKSMRPKCASLAMALGFVTSGIVAAAAEITATTSVVSANVFRGQRLAGVSLQPTIEAVGGPASAGIAASAALQHRPSDVAEFETDLFAGYRWPLSGRVGLRPGFTAYFYRGAPANYRSAVIEPNLALDFTVGAVRFTPVYYRDLTRNGSTVELNAAVALPLPTLGTELDLTLTAGTSHLNDAFSAAAPKAALRGDYGQFDASVPWQITTHAKITLGLSYVTATNAHLQPRSGPRVGNPLATERAVVRLAYSYAF
jgi:hypothetical protein